MCSGGEAGWGERLRLTGWSQLTEQMPGDRRKGTALVLSVRGCGDLHLTGTVGVAVLKGRQEVEKYTKVPEAGARGVGGMLECCVGTLDSVWRG